MEILNKEKALDRIRKMCGGDLTGGMASIKRKMMADILDSEEFNLSQEERTWVLETRIQEIEDKRK